jgi:hypothetical protein
MGINGKKIKWDTWSKCHFIFLVESSEGTLGKNTQSNVNPPKKPITKRSPRIFAYLAKGNQFHGYLLKTRGGT